MAKKNRLTGQAVNRILESISSQKSEFITLPSGLSLSNEIGVSRTVIRNALDDLLEKGLIKKQGRSYVTIRSIQSNDYYDDEEQDSDGATKIQQYFLDQVNRGDLRPGTRFSVLELATASGCNRTIVREFLYSFSKFGLVEKLPRKMWGMVSVDKAYFIELIETRKILELKALDKVWQAPETDPIWQDLERCYQTALSFMEQTDLMANKVSNLEASFYRLLFSPLSNRFIQQFYEIAYYVFCFHTKWWMEEEEDQLNARLVQMTSLLEYILIRDRKACVKFLDDFYQSAFLAFEESIAMIGFP